MHCQVGVNTEVKGENTVCASFRKAYRRKFTDKQHNFDDLLSDADCEKLAMAFSRLSVDKIDWIRANIE